MFGLDLSFFAFLGACFAAAMSGAMFPPGEWYETLRKPSWQPPNWLFPVAWSVLYLMIAVSGWLVWQERATHAMAVPMIVYGVQLVANFLWSALFFGMKRMDIALIEVGILWLSIVATIVVFWPVSTTAALLLLPYLAWVSFAAYLNFVMLRLNPEQGTGKAA